MTEPDTTTSPSRQLFDDAVRALTAAARLDSGPDFAEFVPLAVAGAAANLGGAETALVRRSRSWEAERVWEMLLSTVGEDPGILMTPPGPSCLARKSHDRFRPTSTGRRGAAPAPSITS